MLFKLLSAAESVVNSAAGSASDSGAGGGGGGYGWVMWVGVIVICALLFIPGALRQKKERKAYEEKLNNLSVGTKITTIGLIVGEIVSMDENTVLLKTGEGDLVSYLTVEKRAIYQVVPTEEYSDGQEGLPTDDTFDGQEGLPTEEYSDGQEGLPMDDTFGGQEGLPMDDTFGGDEALSDGTTEPADQSAEAEEVTE